MRENKLRTLWANDQAAVNGWLAIANSFSAETMAHQGWDTLTIDLQHGVVDYPAMVGMLQAISTTATVPIVRVPWLEPGIIMKALDAGAYGVICPMVNTREEAQRFVAGRLARTPEGLVATAEIDTPDGRVIEANLAMALLAKSEFGIARVVARIQPRRVAASSGARVSSSARAAHTKTFTLKGFEPVSAPRAGRNSAWRSSCTGGGSTK